MSNVKTFTKNQTVILFQSWDWKGTWNWQRVIVASCGTKKATLVSESGEMLGRNFNPESRYIVADMTDEHAEEMAMNFAKEERESSLASWTEGLKTVNARAYQNKIDDLHELIVVRK